MSLLHSLARFAIAACSGPLLVGCVTGDPVSLRRQTDDDGGTGPIAFEAGSPADARFDLPTADPHALVSVTPGHGSFAGNDARIVRGSGFTVSARVWFGASEVPQDSVLPLDANRLQVSTPPGPAGPVDVSVQLGDDASTRRTLIGGYLYDAFYLDPASGPTAGGTIVHLHGQGTHWGAGTTVTIGGAPCQDVTLISPIELACTLPKSAPGAKSVTVTTSDQASITAMDAYTYGDSDNGFRGGLSGSPLASTLRVIALNSYTDDPVVGALVIADAASSELTARTDSSGIALFQDANLGPTRTVTVAAKCYQPTTFVDVPVDTVTVYVDPVFSPACVSGGDPPSTGGHAGSGSIISGQVVWRPNAEFKRDGWRNVPAPASPDEQQVAYVFTMSSDPTDTFQLPDPSLAIHPDASGDVGYPFQAGGPVGNVALYALAGIENRKVTPPTFTAYAMGVLQGVLTQPSATVQDVYIPMDITLDQAVTMALRSPTPTPRGPDRAKMSVAVQLGSNGYAIFPVGQKQALVPVDGTFAFVGLPPLTGALAGARYISSGSVGTGPTFSTPRSVVASLASTDPSQVVALDDFVPIPSLVDPGSNGAWNGRHLQVAIDSGTTPDLILYQIDSGNGLVSWLVAAPGRSHEVSLPDLATLAPEGALLPGALQIGVYAARIDQFDYGSLLYRQLATRGWNAYALDFFSAHIAP